MPAGSPTISRYRPAGPDEARGVISSPDGIRVTESASSPDAVRVIIFNDHPVFQSALAWKIGSDSGIEVIADAPSLHETLALAERSAADGLDAVIADLRIGDGNSEGVESVATLASRLSGIPIIVNTDFYSSSYATRMTEAGATALVQKSAGPDPLVAAIIEAVSQTRTSRGKAVSSNGSAA